MAVAHLRRQSVFLLLAAFTLPTAVGLGGGTDDEPSGPGGSHARSILFAGRSDTVREKMLREGGGSTRSESAVASGLKWLSRHQAADGHWGRHDFHTPGHCNCGDRGQENDAVGTGLALLAFLGCGETHKGGSVYAKKVQSALAWIVAKQAADGAIGDAEAHPLCTLCLCEAYALTTDPQLRAPARRALDRLVKTQNKSGGWDDIPRAAGPAAATGVWQILALRAGQAAELNVPKESLEEVRKPLEELLTADLKEGASAVLAARLLSGQAVGLPTKHPLVVKGTDALGKRLPDGELKDLGYYFFATEVMHNQGSEGWNPWNGRIRDLLIATQDQGQLPGHPDQKGSWSPLDDPLAKSGGRLTTTALAVLTLEVYYRHLPLYAQERKREEPAKP